MNREIEVKKNCKRGNNYKMIEEEEEKEEVIKIRE